MIKLSRLNNYFVSFGGKTKSEKDVIPENKLERSPATDSVNLSKVSSKKKIRSPKQAKTPEQIFKETQTNLEFVRKEEILPEEVLYFLAPKVDAKGNASFTPAQTRIIEAASNKVAFFKTMARKLSDDAFKYGDEILDDMKKVFGGREGLGEYLVVRKKDPVSVYNKLIKEFKNERIKSEVFNVFARKLYNKRYSQLDKIEKKLVSLSIKDGDVKLDARDYKVIEDAFKSDPKDYFANKLFNKPYSHLVSSEKNIVKQELFNRPDEYKANATNKQARREATSYVRDLVGIRLILPTGNRTEMAKVEKYIEKAIQNCDIKMTRMSNYHSSHILPYIKKEKALLWKEMTGMELVENSEVRKKNGYTTTQINLEQNVQTRSKPVLVELQIRTEALNYIGNIEHLIYDILEKKDISKGIPQLKEYYDSIGIVKAVKEVFNDPAKEEKYTDYEKAYYAYVRNKEESGTNVSIAKPLLAEFGLGEYEHLLSFDALEVIDNKAKEIKAVFGPKKNKW